VAVDMQMRETTNPHALALTIESALKRGDHTTAATGRATLDELMRARPIADDPELLRRAARLGSHVVIEPLVVRITEPARFGKSFDDPWWGPPGDPDFDALVELVRHGNLEPRECELLLGAVRVGPRYRDKERVIGALALAAALADARAIPVLLETAARSDWYQHETARVAAYRAIGARAREALEDVVAGEGDQEARVRAANALGGIADRESVGVLLLAARDPHDSLREVAVWGLSQIAEDAPDRVLFDAFVHASEDAVRGVRVRAEQALRWARRVAEGYLESVDPDTARRIREIIKE
jgi:hypothetical protein